jgi:hypothetical protein
MKNGVFWVVTPCGSCKNRRFGGTWLLIIKLSVLRGLFLSYAGFHISETFTWM